ncbi:MAG: hypothetical protein JXB14_07660, partial [Candidatus Altiarchaeota archaeon]|nr:hypothetical protein [Candidatus Altiarchaeota archaeon]
MSMGRYIGLLSLFCVVLVLPPSSLADIDLSEYIDLVSSAQEKEREYNEAWSNAQYGKAFALEKELESLRKLLDTDKMKTVKKYVEARQSIQEIESEVIPQIQSTFPESDIVTTLHDKLAIAERYMLQADAAYNSSDYAAASELILRARDELSVTITSGILLSIAEIDKVEGELVNANYFTPSLREKLDTARDELNKAKQLYEEGKETLLSGTNDTTLANQYFKEAYEHASSAFGMIMQVRELAARTPLESIIRWSLVLVPMALVLGLLLFFYKTFRRIVIRSSLSKTKVEAGKKTIIDRTISVVNPEN